MDDIRPPALRRPAAAPVRATAPVPTRRDAGRKTGAPAARTPLRARRKQARKRVLAVVGTALLVLAVLVIILLWQPWLRVGTVEANGPDSEKLKAFVTQELSGTRYFVFPRNSIFFIPDQAIRAHILATFPEVAAVSIHPSGLTALTVSTTPRESIAWWCGGSIPTPADSCYEVDAQGLVFAPVPLDQRFATDSALSLYVPLAGGAVSPLGSSITDASKLPQIMQFVKAMRELNADVVSVAIRGDEADVYTAIGTRITYVVGREEQAANLAASAFPTLNLNDGSLEYVDLRFESKVFFKKKGK